MSYIKKKSQKQEKKTAKEFGGRTQVASGAIDGLKGDVRNDTLLIENKFTDKDFYKLDLKTWDKIYKEAIKDDLRIPLMQIDIQDLSLVLGISHDIDIVVPVEDYCKKYITTKSVKIHKSLFDDKQLVVYVFKGLPYHLVVVKKDLFLDQYMQT